MINEIGHYALVLALGVGLIVSILPVIGARRNDRALMDIASLGSVVKTTVFLRDMNDFGPMNEVYGRHFGSHRPARSTVQAARLPRDVAVEIEAIALVG